MCRQKHARKALQELNMLFDRKNGLSPGKYYQASLEDTIANAWTSKV